MKVLKTEFVGLEKKNDSRVKRRDITNKSRAKVKRGAVQSVGPNRKEELRKETAKRKSARQGKQKQR